MILRYIIVGIVGYLLGNISTGIIISKYVGHTDIRQHGSGSSGATNMLRTLGWLPSILTLLGDCLKALLASLIGKWIGGEIGMCVGGVMAVVGHIWPAFLKFKGGKGVSCGLGQALVMNPFIGLGLLAYVVFISKITHMVSVGSISAAILLPILTAIFHFDKPAWIIAEIVVCLLVVFSHRSNIKRIFTGSENKLDFEKINDISKGGMKK